METAERPFDGSQVLQAVGKAIRAMRLEKGISQEELSYLCQLDRSHMGRIERGERNVSFFNLLRISRGLQCKPSDILLRADL
ncbi:helix-turn-helix domain-containing protein [Massilia sp. UYP32]|uniref:helix-turn-helix domain-containing protein n=1 Tax=Massilia sp. UYP32 TaxID=1756386 RepID=UPI003D1B201E